MSFEDDMIEYGFSDGNDYMDYLMDEADRMYEKQEEHNRRAEEYEAWLNSLSDTERQYLQEEENIQRRERKKRQKDAKQKRLDEELVLKLWAKDNPQKAKMWYAYYTHSPEVNNVYFEQFLETMGASGDNLWNGYADWKCWLKIHEAYQEFKEKAHEVWEQIKVNKYRKYIENAAQELLKYTQESPYCEEFGCCKKGAADSKKILNKWINSHSELWKEISFKYKFALKTENKYYEVWKQLKADKWEKWQQENFELWKCKAQNVDLWFAWLFDKNEWTFHEWASLHLKEGERFMDEAMKWDYRLAYGSLFGGPCYDFDKWKKDNSEEWEYWKEAIREQILMDEFAHNSITLPYHSEYMLHIQIQEKLYLHKIGKEIFHNHLAVIQDNNKYGFINEDGFVVIKPQYDKVLPFQNGMAPVKIGESTYDEYVEEFEDYVEIKIGGKWGFINDRGKFVFEPQFDNIFIKDDMIIFSKGGELEITNDTYKLKNSKWGMMNKNMQEIIPAKYDFLALLDNGLFAARKRVGADYKWALLSNNGVEITPFKYSYIYNSEEDCLIANKGGRYKADENECYDYYDGEWGYLNMEGKEIEPFIIANNKDEFMAMWECMHD